MWQNLASLLVSHSCYGCDRLLTQQEQCICFHCLGQIPETDFHLCSRENELYYRIGGRVPLQGASSLYFFEKGGTLQRIIRQLKYEDAPHLGQFLGKMYGAKIRQTPFLAGIEAVVPVPLHRRKEIKRGYNQALRLAEGLAEGLQIPVRTDLLYRSRYTAAQARQIGQARWDNVKSAFRPTGESPGGVLLVDDVITTGATAVACAQALYAGAYPPEQISVLSIAMARQG